MRIAFIAGVACVVMFVPGCAGNTSVATFSPYVGTWSGTWVNVNDASDAGTSTWKFDRLGNLDGQDFDPGRSTTFHVVGSITPAGILTSNSTPTGGSPASLNGTLRFSSNNQISGILAWGVTPVLNYKYSFTRN